MSLISIASSRSPLAFVASAGFLSLAQFQTGLTSIEESIRQSQSNAQVWPTLIDFIHRGHSSPSVSPFLIDYGPPSFAGAPSTKEITSIVQELRARITPGPIRRDDPIAQNTFRWAGGRTAVRQGGKTVTYKRLDARADAVATFFAGCIRTSGRRAAIFFSQNRPNVFEIVLGARRAGVAFTNFHSYLSGEAFVENIMANPYRVLFLDSESLLKIESYLPLLQDQELVVVDIDSQHPQAMSYGQLLLESQRRPAASTPDEKPPDYPGPVMYSSGTTADPKLISVKSTSKVGAQANRLFGITEKDRNLVIGQLYHGGAYSWAKGHLNRGAEVVLLETSGLTLHPKETLNEIEKRKVTNFWISPPWLQGLCTYLEDGYLTVLGRTIEQIESGGVTIFPRVIENHLMEMADVHDCHVIGIPDPDLGEIAVAAVVPEAGVSEIHSADVLKFLSERGGLDSLEGRPLNIVIVPSLPRKPYKVNNRILREMIEKHGRRG